MSKRERRLASKKARPHQEGDRDEWTGRLTARHMRLGWWSLLLFLTLGITLEAMHGFKVQWYVGEQNSTRRLMWTLAHAHGTLLALVHLAFAAAVNQLGPSFKRFGTAGSWLLVLAAFLLPAGFFAGGIVVYDGDPGVGVVLVPIGGGLLVVAVLLTAMAVQGGLQRTGETNPGTRRDVT